MPDVDILVAAALAIGALRGLFLGLVREAFSLGSLAAGALAGRAFGAAGANALRPYLGAELPEPILLGVGAVAIGLAVLIAVRITGALVRRTLQAVGLGPADRLAGGVLGLAEGAVVSALALLLAGALLGPGHPALAGSRAFAALQDARGGAAPAPRDVAAPPVR
jgi:membrane protein required for colicin V production